MFFARIPTARAVLTSLLIIPCAVFPILGNAITCPAGTIEDRLDWADVWQPGNDNVYGAFQTFTSQSGQVDFRIRVETSGGAGCSNADIDGLALSNSAGPDPVLSLGVDWANLNCQVQVLMEARVAQTTSSFNLDKLEFTLFDIDVGTGQTPLFWVDVIRYGTAPTTRTNPPSSDFAQTPTTTTAQLRCDNTPQQIPNCQQTPSWDGPLSTWEYFYEAGSLSQGDPAFQIIRMSDLEFCVPEPNLVITKVGNPDPVRKGQNLVYTLTVTNAETPESISNAIAAVLQDTLPAGLTWISTTNSNGGGTCTVSDLTACSCSLPGNTGDVTCEMGDFTPGQSKTVVITTRVN